MCIIQVEFFYIYRIENDADCSRAPNRRKNTKSESSAVLTERAYTYGRIGSCDKKEDRAVVEDLKDSLWHQSRGETVIQTRHGVEHYERCAVYCTPQHSESIAIQGGIENTEDQRDDTEAATDYVGHHIEYFLSPRIIGKDPVTELRSCHIIYPTSTSSIKYYIIDFQKSQSSSQKVKIKI